MHSIVKVPIEYTFEAIPTKVYSTIQAAKVESFINRNYRMKCREK